MDRLGAKHIETLKCGDYYNCCDVQVSYIFNGVIYPKCTLDENGEVKTIQFMYDKSSLD